MEQNELILLYGTDYLNMAKALLRAADLKSEIGGTDRAVALKPNLVVPAPASGGATTHPELVAGVLEYLQENGFRNVWVMEGSWVGSRTPEAAAVNGLRAVCDRYGVPFYDLQKDTWREYDAAGMRIQVCVRAMAADYLINMPVLKGHGQTLVTCALKNAKGLLPNCEKRRFHALGLHKPIAHLNTVIPRGLILADNICGDLDFEEGGNPVTMNRIFCCKDPVLCDSFACRTMGYDAGEVPYIGLAERLGVGCADLSKAKITALNESREAAQAPKPTGRVRELARYTAPDSACSACYGSLIYALSKLESESGPLHLPDRLCIGQGYRGKHGRLGVGNCTCAFAQSVPGCPPSSADICRFLRTLK